MLRAIGEEELHIGLAWIGICHLEAFEPHGAQAEVKEDRNLLAASEQAASRVWEIVPI